MKDLKKLSEECIAELSSIGIAPGNIRRIYVEKSTTRRWGVCKKIKAENVFEIGIAKVLLEDSIDDMQTKNTIMHELLHTVDGCSGHTGLWKALAEKVNTSLPGYNIKRLSSEEEKGVQRNHKYMIECTGCGAVIYRDRMSNAVRFPGNYKCARCGGALKRIY